MSVPRLAFPIVQGTNGHLRTVPQDSIDEVAQCVEILLRTEIGARDELPAFGTTDLTFEQMPLDVEPIAAQVEHWEPRARVRMAQDLQGVAALVAADGGTAQVRVSVSRGG
jgi:phage baseplate assembly protein W